MPDNTPGSPGDEPEHPESWSTQPLPSGSRPTEPLPEYGPQDQGGSPGAPGYGSPGAPGYGSPGQTGAPGQYGPPAQPGQPGPYGPYGYGYGPGYPYPAAPQTEGTATAALVIAIVGFFVCPPVGPIVALILALNAERKIRQSGGRLTGLDQAKAARIIAIVELVLIALGVLALVLFVLTVTSSGSSSSALGLPLSVARAVQRAPGDGLSGLAEVLHVPLGQPW